MTVIIMLFGLNIGETIFSVVFYVPTFVVSCLIAPLLGKYIKFS